MKYRVLQTLMYPTDPAVIAALQAGENLPMHARAMKTAKAGEIVDDLPECCVAGLLKKGRIEAAKGGRK